MFSTESPGDFDCAESANGHRQQETNGQMTDNPYAAPETLDEFQVSDSIDGIIGVENQRIVCLNQVRLPESCVKTASQEDLVEVRKKLYWSPSWIWVLLFMHLIAVAVAYLITRKRVEVVYYVDRRVRNSWRIRNLFGALLFLGGSAGLIAGMIREVPWEIVTGLLALLLGLFFVVRYSAMVKPVAHNDGVFQLSGLGDEFLAIVREKLI